MSVLIRLKYKRILRSEYVSLAEQVTPSSFRLTGNQHLVAVLHNLLHGGVAQFKSETNDINVNVLFIVWHCHAHPVIYISTLF